MSLYAVLLGLCWFSFCTASNPDKKLPGIVVWEKPEFLTFISDYVFRYLDGRYIYILHSMPNNTIDKQCFFGMCSLYNFKVKNYTPPTSNVTFKRGFGIAWNLTGAGLDVSLDFEVKTTDAAESTSVMGNAHVVLMGLSFAAVFELGRKPHGNLFKSLTHCSVDVDSRYSDINETWKGKNTTKHHELFYKHIDGYLQDTVFEAVNKSMCDLARAIASIPDFLHNISHEASYGITFDTHLVRDPILAADNLEMAFNGEFRSTDDNLGASFQPRQFDLNSMRNSSMVSIFISEYVINTFYDVLFKKNWLTANITKDILPSQYHNLFDTTCEHVCLGTIFPTLAANYPNRTATFLIKASSRPWLTFTPMLQRSHVESELNIMIPGVNGSEAAVANFSMSVAISKTVTVSKGRIDGRVFDPKITIRDNGSPKEFASEVRTFEYVLQLIADGFLVPYVNCLGAVGYPLYVPFTKIRLVNAEMRILEGAFGFNTDFVYDPLPL